MPTQQTSQPNHPNRSNQPGSAKLKYRLFARTLLPSSIFLLPISPSPHLAIPPLLFGLSYCLSYIFHGSYILFIISISQRYPPQLPFLSLVPLWTSLYISPFRVFVCLPWSHFVSSLYHAPYITFVVYRFSSHFFLVLSCHPQSVPAVPSPRNAS